MIFNPYTLPDPESIGAQRVYTSLGQLGLTNDDMSATDFAANMVKLVAAMPPSARLLKYGNNSGDNLTKSIVAKLGPEVGIAEGDYYVTLDFTTKPYKDLATEVNVSVTHISPYVEDTYSCIFYDNKNVSKFSRNRPVEYFWNLNPDSCGHSSLLAYMASRYDDHPVIFAHVNGFNDLHVDADSGQAVINICGGIMTVTLHTRTGVWYRGTNSLTEWTEHWRTSYDSRTLNSGSANTLTDGVWKLTADVKDTPAAVACAIYHKTWDGNFKTQLCIGADSKRHFRTMSGGTWGAWQMIYDSGHLPYTYSQTDITAGSTALETGKLYLVYE